MQIGVLGGGPAGLYFSLLMKRSHPSRDITVVERNPAGATYGWGVVFSDRTLASFQQADPETYEEITDRFVIWDAIDVRIGGEVVRCGGQVFSGISRRALLRLLQQRCSGLGVKLIFEEEFSGPERFEAADVIVAADGVRSPTRAVFEETFRPSLALGRSKYVWFGTTLPLDSFTFMFRKTEHGFFQVHSYPFDGATSTFIVETTGETWRRAGLDEMSEEESLAFCEDLFAEELRGHRLMSNKSLWLNFVTVKNKKWSRRNVVLVGDAAHTAHFSIGSGTKLAMEDAISLAGAFDHAKSVEDALAYYEAERRPPVTRFQHAAAQSQSYFENTERYQHLEPLRFAFNLLSRSGRMDYDNIRVRDRRFVAGVDASLDKPRRSGGLRIGVPPGLHPLALRDLVVPNRVALEVDGPDGIEAAVASGAGLLLTRMVPVEPEGRISPSDRSLFEEPWRSLRFLGPLGSDFAQRTGPALGVRLGHAGARGSCADRSRGLDRPLEHGWSLIAPSADSYAPWSPAPRAMDRADMERVRDSFVASLVRARELGFELAVVDMANGYLLSEFLSPITNLRSDDYGGDIKARMRFPLEVFDAARRTWPDGLPIGVRIAATEWARGGTTTSDTVRLVKELVAEGCDLVEVTAGGLHASRPRYDPYYLPSYADLIRNETGAQVLATGQIGMIDDVHTLVGGGRADLCLLIEGPRRVGV